MFSDYLNDYLKLNFTYSVSGYAFSIRFYKYSERLCYFKLRSVIKSKTYLIENVKTPFF